MSEGQESGGNPMKEEFEVLTGDRYQKGRGAHHIEKHFDSFPVMSMVTVSELFPVNKFVELLRARRAELLALADEIITKERAEFVRAGRVNRKLSWRMIAAGCHKVWANDLDAHVKALWEPEYNQIVGRCLCETAARYLGEDPEVDPWN